MTLYKASIFGTIASGAESFTTTCHLNTTSNPDTTLDGWSTAVSALFSGASGIATVLPTYTVVTGISVVSIDPSTGKQVTRVDGAVSYPGTGSGNNLPPQTCVLMSHTSANASRGGRGRMYLPAPTSSHVSTSGVLSGAATTVYASSANQWFASLGSSNLQLVIFHRAAGTFTPVTDVRIAAKFATQDRRKNKIPNTYTT